MPTLGHITPFCIVSDLRHAADFYRDAIGFRIVCLVPEDDPFLTIVECDSMRIMLKAIAPDVAPQPNYTRHEWAR